MSSDRATPVERLMQSRIALAVMAQVPVPLRMVRPVLLRDNAEENAKDSWNRLRDRAEQARYAAVRAAVEVRGADGFVLDVGCSQAILQEGLRYRRYLGIDSFPASVALASAKADGRTAFVCADGADYVPDTPPDVVVFNEVLYYLPDPVAVVEHHAGLLAPGGVIVVSIYARSWASRRLLHHLSRRLDVTDSSTVTSGRLAWSVVTFARRG